MGMSINERIAMQARAAAATHVNPGDAPKTVSSVSAATRAMRQAAVASQSANVQPAEPATGAGMSAAQRVARQGTVARQSSARAATAVEQKDAPATTVAERIQRQAAAVSVERSSRPESPEALLAECRKKYEIFLANADKMIAEHGPMVFVAGEARLSEAVPVSGISTAEGEIVIEAKASEPVPGMPFQATPVITEVPFPLRTPRRAKR